MTYQLIPSVADPCVYYSFLNESTIIHIIYVDNGLVFYSPNSNIFEILAYLENAFDHTCGFVHCYVCICITRDHLSQQLFVDQQHYIQSLLAKYGYFDISSSFVSVDPYSWLCHHLVVDEPVDIMFPYKAIIGSL